MSPEMSHDAVPDQHTPVAATPTPGAVLAAHRREAGLSVADVSDKLKLSKRQVEALEADDYRALPGNTFVRGFVRNYARLLGLDAQPLIQFLDGHLPKETSQAALPRLRDEALPVLRPGGSGSKLPSLLGVVAGLAIVFGGIGAYWYYQQHGRVEPELTLKDTSEPEPVPASPVQQLAPQSTTANDSAAPVDASASVSQPAAPVETPAAAPAGQAPVPAVTSGATPVATVPAAVQPSSPAAAPTAPAQKPAVPAALATTTGPASSGTAAANVSTAPAVVPMTSGDLRVVARQDSWVQVTDATGRRLINQVLSAGESRSVGGTPPYKVRIGNGPHTELYYKGKPTDLTPYIKVDVANIELN